MLSFRRKEQPENRRRSERIAVRGPAQMTFGAGSLPRDCWISDISDGGVRLHTERGDVPDEFTLLLAGGTQRRDCRVAWRLGHEIGAQFVQQEQGFARKIAGSFR